DSGTDGAGSLADGEGLASAHGAGEIAVAAVDGHEAEGAGHERAVRRAIVHGPVGVACPGLIGMRSGAIDGGDAFIGEVAGANKVRRSLVGGQRVFIVDGGAKEIGILSLHDALPIYDSGTDGAGSLADGEGLASAHGAGEIAVAAVDGHEAEGA